MKIVNYNDRPDVICLFDFSHLVYMTAFSKNYKMLTKKDGEFSGHIYGLTVKVLSLLKKFKGLNISMVYGVDGWPQWKRDIYPEYKTNRLRPEERQEFNPRPDCLNLIKNFKCTILTHSEEEADDIISTFCYLNRDKNIIIFTSDRDFCQLLVEKNVIIYDPIRKIIINRDYVKQDYGIDCRNIVLYKSIFGDSSDNIHSPVPRIKRKKIVEVIEKSNGSLPDFWREMKKSNDIDRKAMLLLDSAKEQIEKIYQIVKLKTDVQYSEVNKNGNRSKLEEIFKYYECDSLMNKIGFLVGE